MSDPNPEIENLRAFTYGMQATFMATMSALIRSHPDPKVLRQFLDLYCQREQAYLENRPFPEEVLDSFQQIWKRVEKEIRDAEESHLQQSPVQD